MDKGTLQLAVDGPSIPERTMKPSQSLMARLRLTTKQVNKGYYKGTRSGSMGFWANNGSTYIIDWKKVRTYVVPENLKDFKVRLQYLCIESFVLLTLLKAHAFCDPHDASDSDQVSEGKPTRGRDYAFGSRLQG